MKSNKGSPTKYHHSADWNQHRNKWQSKEYWSKHRMKSEEELRREVEEYDEDSFSCGKMGYYLDENGIWRENGIDMGWCKECGAKIRFCKCGDEQHEDK